MANRKERSAAKMAAAAVTPRSGRGVVEPSPGESRFMIHLETFEKSLEIP